MKIEFYGGPKDGDSVEMDHPPDEYKIPQYGTNAKWDPSAEVSPLVHVTLGVYILMICRNGDFMYVWKDLTRIEP